MIKINVVFDNGGGTTIMAEGYAHYYSSPAAAAEDYIAMTSPSFKGFDDWEGNEPDAVLTYDAEQERNNGYLWLDNDDIKAEVKRDWGFNTETFYNTLRRIEGGNVMLLKRDLFDRSGKTIGEYYINTEDTIKVTLNGVAVVEKDLAPDDQNALSKYTDAFEDGFNHVTNGEEWYEVAGFRFSRPVYDESAGLSRVENCGNVRGHYDVDIVKINGRRYALDGWNGEKFHEVYEVNEAGHAVDPTGPSYTATPVYKQLGEDEFEIIDYDIG